VSITKENLIILPITDEMDKMAGYIAEKRKLFEYPREGYGDYDSRGIERIKAGILGELGFLEFIFSNLEKKYNNFKADDRWEILNKKVKFSYNIVIGKFDEGFEFKIDDKTIDIKTYENNIVTVEQIFAGLSNNGRPLNLLIDKTQNAKADYYVQVFMLPDKKICLAGYFEGLPPIATWMPNPAYTCPVPDLLNISILLDKI